ncbi:uncharacterized protein LOC115245867 [Formica exsecta]|uniref:uncharacterized protein LOC115245867 n=1 Tax=Formica exsecta TaxID=72781 RepID=UPI0011430E15|nr:uncharacterized protein LOC115245867 [Formica exsecta]
MNTLSWERQVTMTNKIHSILYQLKLCKHLLPETFRSKLVTTLIYPHVDYCCAAYMDMTAEHNLKLHRAINYCIRFIFNVKADMHITPYYKRLRWLKIDLRRTYFVGCLLFRILRTGQPGFLHSNFNQRVLTSDRATRVSNNTLIQPQCRTELFKRSFRVTSVRLWNGLPLSIKNAKTLNDFKQRLYTHSLVCYLI